MVPPMTTAASAVPGLSQGGSNGATTATPATTVLPKTATAPVPGSTPYYSEVSQTSVPTNRMVVRTGNIQLVVSDVSQALDNIVRLANDYGGYVVTSQKWKEGERNLGAISIRVLAENYDSSVSALRALSMSVISESSSSQDVTQEYVDLDSRVKNLEATEVQLLKIMETAAKTEDILSIQRELTSVRGDIEQSKGRMLYLQQTSSTSLIDIRLSEAVLDLKFSADKVRVDQNESVLFTSQVSGGFTPYNYLWEFGDGNTSVERSPVYSYKDSGMYAVTLKVTDDKGYTSTTVRDQYISVVGSWNPGSIAKSAWSGFLGFGHVSVNILIWLGIFSPVWIIIGGIIWFGVYRSRRKKLSQDKQSLKD